MDVDDDVREKNVDCCCEEAEDDDGGAIDDKDYDDDAIEKRLKAKMKIGYNNFHMKMAMLDDDDDDDSYTSYDEE